MARETTLELSPLTALSPLDGRYMSRVGALRNLFSEWGLIRYRVRVEVSWLVHLASEPDIAEVPRLSPEAQLFLDGLWADFTVDDAERVKSIEKEINHDVKAVEYFLKESLSTFPELESIVEFVHFGCTSEDINNLAYALMLDNARRDVLLPAGERIKNALISLSDENASTAMLARTHGQPASPTTLGKEIANVIARFEPALREFGRTAIAGKFNGAVGNYNAHLAAYPGIGWPDVSRRFIKGLGLDVQAMSTQIEPHDQLAALCHAASRINTILIDLSRDLWSYISIGYFRSKSVTGEVGSSTMPHKINPIDLENAEGNLGLANALLNHLAEKLPISRWQRDLTDSTVMRNLGTAMGHSLIGWTSLTKGLDKLATDQDRIAEDLDSSWEVLAEAIQTVMRRHGIAEPYEKLKALTRGQKNIDRASIRDFVATLDLPADAKKRLLDLTPATYTGNADRATREFLRTLSNSSE